MTQIKKCLHTTSPMFQSQFLRRRYSIVQITFCQLTVELISEGIQQVRYSFLHGDISLQLSAQRRHSFTFDPARHDVAEPRQVGVAVQSQAVRRDVSTTVDSWKKHNSQEFSNFMHGSGQ